ncbi:VOC family protein [Roseivirga sp. BDSF3-8]|uniref:VOC family protein n=1 Tax=Roseivirga sp. BDSF3-8 TaxID=3241598 RepID=UPI0035324C22
MLDHIEIIVPLAKPLAYWHTQALGFQQTAVYNEQGKVSYLLEKGSIRLLITSAYDRSDKSESVLSFIGANHTGVRRIAFQTDDVEKTWHEAIKKGAIPLASPANVTDDEGSVETATVRLYDKSEICYISRKNYKGHFMPGFVPTATGKGNPGISFEKIDHVASEVRVNEMAFWAKYLSQSINTELIQEIPSGPENTTGIALMINKIPSSDLTFVIAEPAQPGLDNKIQGNIDQYGSAVHHLAFACGDLLSTVETLHETGVEFVEFPSAYYDLLRENEDLKDLDIDRLERLGVLVDKEGDGYLLQKFIKPFSDMPFLFYELVERVNGYTGFALKNIKVLKKAEELQIMKQREPEKV